MYKHVSEYICLFMSINIQNMIHTKENIHKHKKLQLVAVPAPDVQLEMSAAYLSDCLKDFRQSVQKSTKKGGKKPTHGAVYVSLEYQE